MAIAVRGTHTYTDSGGTTALLDLSNANAVAGDFAILTVTGNASGATWSLDRTGWTAYGTSNIGTTLSSNVFWKVLTAQDISDDTVTATSTATCRKAASVIVLSGVNGSAPLDSVGTNPVRTSQTTGDQTFPFAAIDPTDLAFVLVTQALNGATQLTGSAATSGWTEIVDVTTATSQREAGTFAQTYDSNPTSASVSGGDTTPDAAAYGYSWTFALALAPQTVSTGQPSETDSARTANPQHAAKPGYPTSTETARTITPVQQGGGGHTVSVVYPTSTETARTIKPVRGVPVARALAGEAARGVGAAHRTGVVYPYTDESARPVKPRKTLPVGRSAETDSARAITPRKIVKPGQPAETDTARTIKPVRGVPVARALAGEAARGVTAARRHPVVYPYTDESARPVKPRKTLPVGQAVETDSARTASPVQAGAPKQVAVDHATETDSARPARPAKVGKAYLISSPEAGRPVTPAKVVHVGQAVETDSARTARPARRYPVAPAAESDGPLNTRPYKVVHVGRAAESSTGLVVVVRKHVVVPVGPAVETDDAGTVTEGAGADVTFYLSEPAFEWQATQGMDHWLIHTVPWLDWLASTGSSRWDAAAPDGSWSLDPPNLN